MSSFSERLKMATITSKDTEAIVTSAKVEPAIYSREIEYNDMVYSNENWIEDKDNYRWFKYEDSNYSIIDDGKNIALNEKQFNITQEENSQFIPFEMPRYYDGIDLLDTTISIHYTRSDGQHGVSEPVNVMYNSEKIRFAWLADASVTGVTGKIKFEIHATGSITDSNGKSYAYVWKTRKNENLNVLQSLCGLDCGGTINVDDSWVQELVESVAEKVAQQIAEAQIGSQVAEAQASADRAEKAAINAEQSVQNALNGYATETYVQKEIEKVDVSDQLVDYALKSEVPSIEGLASEKYVQDRISEVDVSDQLVDYAKSVDVYNKEETDGLLDDKSNVGHTHLLSEITDYAEPDLSGYATETYVQEEIAKVDVSEQLVDYAKSANVYTKEETDNAIANAEPDLTGYATEEYVDGKIQTVNSAITTINQTLDTIDKSPNKTYEALYNDESLGENIFALIEIVNEGKENEERTVKSQFTITGGSGGSSSANTIKIERVTQSPLVVTSDDKVEIEYNFIGTDASGDDIGQGNVTWKLGNRVIKTETVYTGVNKADLTEYLSVASDQKITLIITDDIGTMQQKTWYVSVVDVKLESSFDDTRKYTANSPVTFTYTPYGAVDKTVHYLLDGKEIYTKTSSKAAAGLSDSYSIPAQSHGTHLFEIYMTASVNNNDIESNHIVKDIIWYDETSNVPVISTAQQEFTVRQYEATNIKYTVYDPFTETPNVTLKATYVNEDGEIVEEYNSTLTMSSNTDIWQYKTSVIGEHMLTITCGDTVKVLKANVVELGINITPTTAGLEFDFNPVGYSNNDANRLWTDKTTGVNMSVSDNFDWVNGGYQIDENGDQYFCIKAGTTATINYNLFADDAKGIGKEFKAIFKTTNVKKRDTSFISCMNGGIGLDMKVESANIYSSNGSLYSPYCEEDVIEFEFNINKSEDIPLVLTYEDGVGNRPMIYTSDSSFWQTTPQPITIGSENCDVYIYRMKAYSTSLTDKDILNNFIADARSAEEMIKRYDRNQIYKDGVLNPEHLAEVCPDLRIILVDAPWFTNDKDNKVDDTNVTMIYKNGDPVLDNWTCTGARHSGQGTSSNEYGYAGRNIDLIMDTDTSLFTLGDGVTTSPTITLTRNSVPTDYLNVKVNIASSENQNNAQMAKRYNQYNPFVRSAKFNDNKVKDCMEFYNCIIFVRERDEDISTHREFLDTNYHYYALGNVGDSKKTDDTRVNNKKDPKECIIEITDYNVSLAEFPTGYGENGKEICPVSEWKAGNTAYDFLYADYKYKDGKFKSFGSESYEFRYEMKGITEEQRQVNIDNWRDMYKFIVTSTDEEFYARLKEYFVIDSALYFYLFTERYTMVDNRAKNSFWHYGKVYITQAEAETLGDGAGAYIIDDVQAELHEGYRWDLTQGYDFDTSLGIDNTGKLVLTYGKEDVDYYVDGDSTSGYIYRAAESTFFCRLRDLFKSEMQAMFVDRENVNAWSSSGLIKQWDDAQNQFPEEIWRLDIERKYLRTYLGKSIDNSKPGEANPRFLTEMLNGRKKYQRRMFERNQELYMATKYFGKVATQDQIMMRFNNPVGAVINPDFTLYITPYSDMYIGVSFGNVTPVNFRAKAGIEYTVPCSIESGTADITLIYGASFIQAIGDLSKCYVGDNDFSKASRLQSLVIGSNVTGYENSFMTKISLGNNKLLEYLDIRNITGLNSVVDLSNCGNLLELHSENSGATGVIFANGGKIEKAYIPAVTSLTVKNLNYLKEFIVENYNKLQTLIVENTPFLNTYEIVDNSPILNVLRLIGVNWNLQNTNILERIILMRGVSNTGGEIALSVLTGEAVIPVIGQYALYKYQEAWNDFVITPTTTIKQFVVTFVNDDGTVLDVQYIDQFGNAVDPIKRDENPISTPSKDSTIQYDYTYTGWDSSLLNIVADRTITATYTETLRQYTIQYVSKGTPMQTSTGSYGDNIVYNGDIPVYTAEEPYAYYLFNRWDNSGFLDNGFDENGIKTVNAIFDKFEYSATAFNGKELKDLTPVEIYAMNKLNLAESIITDKDPYSFTIGNDVDYDDIESELLISEKKHFDGTNHIDTGIQLFDEDKDFVLAIDYEFLDGNSSNAVLAQCFQANGTNGFKLWYSTGDYTGAKFTWGTSSNNVVGINKREIIIIRHKKGDNNLMIYKSNLDGNAILSAELTRNKSTIGTSTLVFGCAKADDGYYENNAVGNINWAKVWYKDLGDDVCKSLAMWTHESITLEACGFRKYYLSNNTSKRCSFSLLASHLLGRTKKWNNTNVNTGGWAESALNKSLNTRLYNAMPTQIKLLLQQVIVYSSIGNNSLELSSSNCYITIPSIIEVDSSQSSEPYNSEGSAISYLNTNNSRRRAFDGGNYEEYWLRSPSIGWANYIWRVDKTGQPQAITNASSNPLGVLIEISF